VKTAGPAPHGGRPVVHAGSPLERARAVVVLLHGRGGSPEDMLGLARATDVRLGPDPPEIAWLAPRAAGASWYPESFLAPIERNEPGLSSALAVVEGLVERSAGAGLDGIPVFLGCSDVDPHIPRERVGETASVMEAMGADVDERIYSGMGHTVNDDEIDAVAALIGRAASGRASTPL